VVTETGCTGPDLSVAAESGSSGKSEHFIPESEYKKRIEQYSEWIKTLKKLFLNFFIFFF
jgi:hypothetical protein